MIRAAGDCRFEGYPLPTLLRIALLVLHNPPYKPLDILLSYAHHTLQNSVFAAFVPQLLNRAKVAQLGTASPFSMGLLTPNPPPWHPASAEIIAAKDRAIITAKAWEGGLPDLALGFALSEADEPAMQSVPRVVGLSTMQEVHEAMRVWRNMQRYGGKDEKRKQMEEAVRKVFRDAGCENMSWQSPPLSS